MRPKADFKANSNGRVGTAVLALKLLQGSGGTTPASILTAAENRVLALLTQAITNKEIARDLGISSATVKRPLENFLRKLGLRNRVEAAVYGALVNGCRGYWF